MNERMRLPEFSEETLDPTTDEEWHRLRVLAHRMVDDVLAFHREIRSQPVWTQIPPGTKSELLSTAASLGTDPEVVYQEFLEQILPYHYGNVHPRNWGWVNGQGSPLGSLAEMWAATMNPNCWGAEQSASYVEERVIRWLRDAVGFSERAEGLLVSGGSMGNLMGLAAAREARLEHGASRTGLSGMARPPVVYASTEVHNSIDKAVALLGIGTDMIRRIPVDSDFRIDVDALRDRIVSDRRTGYRPLTVVGSAGTVATGAIDDLDALADLCVAERLWLHVDGAFGAMAALCPRLRPLLRGLERADSVAFDLHKWMYVPIDAGCLLVRDASWLRRIFSPAASYLEHFERGIPSGPHFYSTMGPELTRSFRALKVWFYLRTYGLDKLGRLVEQNVAQARYLESLVSDHPDLELLAPVSLNVVCFRWRGRSVNEADLDDRNRELLMRLWESGKAVISSARITGHFALRAALTNHRTRSEDIEALVDVVSSLGSELASST